jgi:uracil-DNA glycosylase
VAGRARVLVTLPSDRQSKARVRSRKHCDPDAGRSPLMARLRSVGEPTRTLDALVRDQRIAPDWVEALRRVDPLIDGKVEACLTNLSAAGPYLPTEDAIWRAFEVPLSAVRVLVLGQDPYPNPSHAVGLSFSTGPKGPIPASLRSIYVELDEGGYEPPDNGDLSAWSQQGVMLLNRALTLPLDPQARPRRHFRWWAPIVTSAAKVIALEAADRAIAALLWGVPAHRMRKYLEPTVRVFAASHPAPLSAARSAGREEAFRGSAPFTRVNNWFSQRDAPTVDWKLAD